MATGTRTTEDLDALVAELRARPAFRAHAAELRAQCAELFGAPGPLAVDHDDRAALVAFARLARTADDRRLAAAAWAAWCEVHGATPLPAALPGDTRPGDPDWAWWSPGW